jgi:TM2 domain-containing membrane protein YozV
MVVDNATTCPNCNSTAFRAAPGAPQMSQQPPPGPAPGQQVTYNIYHAPHPGAGPAPPAYPPQYHGHYQQPYPPPAAQYVPTVSHKSRLVALLLLVFLGGLGVHRFYVGKVGTGILMFLCTLLAFTVILSPIIAVWLVVDFILILVGSFKDDNGLPVTNWG